MNLANDDYMFHLRQGMYWLLICLSVGVMLGRVMAVDAVDRTALAKDRLSHIAGELDRRNGQLRQQGLEGEALEKELARIETQLLREAQLRRPFLSANDRSRWCTARALVNPDMRVRGHTYAIDKVIQDPNWDTIDMVKHDGHLYSSKPPLMATLMAGIYWIIYHLTGMSLATHPFIVGRIMLVIINVIPLAMSFILLARLAERFGTTDWGRLFVMAAATFGTFLTTFAVAINNHLIAAVCATVAVYAVVPIWLRRAARVCRYFVLAGFFGALMAVDELPALALFAAISLALLCKAPRQTLLAYVPAAMVVTAAFFATNWIAHGSLTIPYMHRGPGDNWYDYNYQRNGKELESYWRHPTGIDLGEQSRAVYALHVLVGHHGIFSLTPIWLLTVAGIFISLWPGRDRRLRQWAVLVGGVSFDMHSVLFVPAAKRTQLRRNDQWFPLGILASPLWLLLMLPAVDYLSKRRWTRGLALVLLIISVFSASYPTWNPWTNPWIMDYMKYLAG